MKTRTSPSYAAKIAAIPTVKLEVFRQRLFKPPTQPFSVGSQLYRTKTIDNDLNPVFNEYYEAVVDQASGQKLRIELFDEDRASADEARRLPRNINVTPIYLGARKADSPSGKRPPGWRHRQGKWAGRVY